MVDTENGPHKSQWIKPKQFSEICKLSLKGNLFCLAKGQTTQKKSSFESQIYTLFDLSKFNLAMEGCPNLKCHICGRVLLREKAVETKEETKLLSSSR